MNLSPDWVPAVRADGFDAVHWTVIGAGNAPDTAIMQWARDHGRVVFTHDLDFGILLAHSSMAGQVSFRFARRMCLRSIFTQSSCAHCALTAKRWRAGHCSRLTSPSRESGYWGSNPSAGDACHKCEVDQR